MKSKIASAICAAALVLALPTLAFGATGSSQQLPSETDPTTGVTIQADLGDSDLNGLVYLDPSNDVADNANLDGAVLTFNLVAGITDGADPAILNHEATLKAYVGTQFAGYDAVLYAVHHDGERAVYTCKVDEQGYVSFTVPKLSLFTVALYESTDTGTGSGTATDNSSVSPKTGYDFEVMALTSAGLLVAGAGALVIRKKIAE
jgi:LPXTG-motif cell wall-anchored protein